MSHPPIGEAAGKKEEVAAMFDSIAPRYDLLNRVLSMGIDRRWRRRAVELLQEDAPKRILDVATGTADLAIKALDLKPERVVGVDISEEMLQIGREKVKEKGFAEVIELRRGDAEKLPFSDAQFDAVLVAFGVRNFENLGRGLREIRRVLKPGGALVVLEFGQPRTFPIKQVYGFYARHILPRIGRTVSGHEGAYRYLPVSAAAFPSGRAFVDRLLEAGYGKVTTEPLTFGIASLYKAYRKG